MTQDARIALSQLANSAAIRPADYGDVDAIVELGRAFVSVSDMEALAAFCQESLTGSIHSMVDAPNAILMVAEDAGQIVGMAGAMIFPAYWNKNIIIGQETFFWVQPDHRGKFGGALLAALEDEARVRGARTFLMVSLEALRPEAVGKLYQRRGYAPLEHSYWKAL